MRPYPEAERDKEGRHHRGDPAARGELLHDRDHQDGGAECESTGEERRTCSPLSPFSAVPKPEAQHRRHRQRKREEHIDRVHDDEVPHVTPGVEQRGQRGAAHQQDPVLGREPLRQRREPVRHPGVHRHIGEHARAVEEPGLGCHDEQGGLREQRHHQEPVSQREPGHDPLHQCGIHGLARNRRHAPEQVADQQSRRRDRERQGHIDHRALGRPHLRLPHDREAVGDRLDPGVGAATQREGPNEEQHQSTGAERRYSLPIVCADVSDRGW